MAGTLKLTREGFGIELRRGPFEISLDGKSVGSIGELRNALSEAKSTGKHDVLMRIKTANNTHFVAMPIG